MGEKTEQPLAGYEVLLCVTGGIACYKSADLTSKLAVAGAGVSVAMTDSARRFVTPLTFQTLSGRQVFTSLWGAEGDWRGEHLALTERADLMVVAPATANIIGKFAAGVADDLVSTLAISASGACPILLAPAMNSRMWSAQPVQANLGRLKEWGMQTVGPSTGRLACGTVGPGRMAEPGEILDAITAILLGNPPKSSI